MSDEKPIVKKPPTEEKPRAGDSVKVIATKENVKLSKKDLKRLEKFKYKESLKAAKKQFKQNLKGAWIITTTKKLVWVVIYTAVVSLMSLGIITILSGSNLCDIDSDSVQALADVVDDIWKGAIVVLLGYFIRAYFDTVGKAKNGDLSDVANNTGINIDDLKDKAEEIIEKIQDKF